MSVKKYQPSTVKGAFKEGREILQHLDSIPEATKKIPKTGIKDIDNTL
jgi:hypothetical protein